MAQGVLGTAGVRRVGYRLEVGRSVRTSGGARAYCVATRTALDRTPQCQCPPVVKNVVEWSYSVVGVIDFGAYSEKVHL